MDEVCLNAIIYDGKMYFAKSVDAELEETDEEEYDIIDENIEAKDIEDIDE